MIVLDRPYILRIALVLGVLFPGATCSWGDEDASLAAKDQTVVQAILRLPNVDLTKYPKAKEALLRHLDRNVGTDEFFRLVRKFELRQLSNVLIDLAVEHASDDQGVEAARLLLDQNHQEAIRAQLQAADDHAAAAMVTALGLTRHPQAASLIVPLLDDAEVSPLVRRAAITAHSRTVAGREDLIRRVVDDQFPEEFHVTLANALLARRDEELQAKLTPHLKLPRTANAAPLPPLGELLAMSGNAESGSTLFRKEGTCIKCHQVGTDGKQVGPALSEIGSKLSREAMFVSILDPSAAISFGFEQHAILLNDGQTLTGVIVSQTEDELTVRDAEALTRTIPREDVEEVIKQSVSIMPQDISQQLSAQQLVDIVEYLLTLRRPDTDSALPVP